MSHRTEYGGVRAVLYWKKSDEGAWGLKEVSRGRGRMAKTDHAYASLTSSLFFPFLFLSSLVLFPFLVNDYRQSNP